MPPTFAYIICLIGYVGLMLAALIVCAPLFLIPSKGRLAIRLYLSILFSLPGIFVCQIVAAIPAGLLLGAVLAFYSIAHPPDWVQWTVSQAPAPGLWPAKA